MTQGATTISSPGTEPIWGWKEGVIPGQSTGGRSPDAGSGSRWKGTSGRESGRASIHFPEVSNPGRGRRSRRALSARARPAEQPLPRHAAQPPPAAPRPRQRTPNSGQVNAAGARNPGGRDRVRAQTKARAPHDARPRLHRRPHSRGPGPSAGLHPCPPVATCVPRAQPKGRWVSRTRLRGGTGWAERRGPLQRLAPPERAAALSTPAPKVPSPSPKPPARTHRAAAPSPARSAGDRS